MQRFWYKMHHIVVTHLLCVRSTAYNDDYLTLEKISMKNIMVLTLLGCMSLSSCITNNQDFTPEEVIGMKPIYVEDINAIEKIEIGDAQEIIELGKLVYAHPYLLVNDRRKGLHIYDNSNPNNPVLMRFISIPGNIDFAVRGNIIYANNFSDLVTFKLNGFDDLEVTSRIKDFYTNISFNNNAYPEDYTGYFECYDESKGVVIGWESTTIYNPQCHKS